MDRVLNDLVLVCDCEPSGLNEFVRWFCVDVTTGCMHGRKNIIFHKDSSHDAWTRVLQKHVSSKVRVQTTEAAIY